MGSGLCGCCIRGNITAHDTICAEDCSIGLLPFKTPFILLFKSPYYRVTERTVVAGDSADSSISSQVVLLVAGLVLGSLMGFLSEIAKEQYSQLESRHVVRLDTLPEANVSD